MPPPRQPIIVDEFGRIKLPWSPAMRPGDRYRVSKLGQGMWKLKLVHAESLAAPKFELVLRALKDRSRDDIHFRQYIRHWLHIFRADRGSFTGRIVFRHAVLAKRELFQPPTLFEYSEDYYRGRLVSPPWVQRAIDEAMLGEECRFTAAELHRSFKQEMQRWRISKVTMNARKSRRSKPTILHLNFCTVNSSRKSRREGNGLNIAPALICEINCRNSTEGNEGNKDGSPLRSLRWLLFKTSSRNPHRAKLNGLGARTDSLGGEHPCALSFFSLRVFSVFRGLSFRFENEQSGEHNTRS